MIKPSTKPAGVSEAFWRSAVTRRWTAEDCARRTRLPVDVFACAGRPREIISESVSADVSARQKLKAASNQAVIEYGIEALKLRERGMSVPVIAERMGVKVETVRKYCQLARNALREVGA